MGRPRKPDALTSAQRAAASRARRRTRTVELSGETMDQLAAIQARRGYPSIAATVQGLARDASLDD